MAKKYTLSAENIDDEWTNSFTRNLIIQIFMYFAIVVYFKFLGIQEPWIKAGASSLFYIFITASMPAFKPIWLKTIYKANEGS